ncbi:porwaprin-c [Anolis carolinensis]|uniref:porwaprin-c n=1 Tax=Anolis carolinensis TaxID=28377 RepID=UPI0004625060|nr:PREDICTED: carwaprin-b [Anolis carolinensis]|eukprot:XP_008117940.1 PREDICTED: carwaprin-b [Anolis carolinensis]
MKPSGGLILLLLGLLAVCAVMPAASGNGNQKPGKCPVAPPGMNTPNCDYKCKEDVHCLGPQKCCQWGCMRICLDPVKI